MKTNKSKSLKFVIMERELSSYFSSPIAYIVMGLFLLSCGFLFFSGFFLNQRNELRQFFDLLPYLFMFFIPAICMKCFSEEKKSGSFETLMTLPVSPFDVVMGKFLACFISSAALLVPTLFYCITLFLFGYVDIGPVIGGYLGAVFLAGAFASVGVFASSFTRHQIVAFFIALGICSFLVLVNMFLVFFPSVVVNFFSYFSVSTHFESISKGVIDTRDIVYFLSVTAIFICLTVRKIDEERL